MNRVELGASYVASPVRHAVDFVRNATQTNPPQSLEGFNKDLAKKNKPTLSAETIASYEKEKKKFFPGKIKFKEGEEEILANYKKAQPSTLAYMGRKTLGALMQVPVQAVNAIVVKPVALAFDIVKLTAATAGKQAGSEVLTKEYQNEIIGDMKRVGKELAVAVGVTSGVASGPGGPLAPTATAITLATGTAVGLTATNAAIAGDAMAVAALGKKATFIAEEENKFSLDNFQKDDPKLYKKYQELQAFKADPNHQGIQDQRQIAATEKWLIDEYANKQNKIMMMPAGGSRTRSNIAAVQAGSHAKAVDRVERLHASLKGHDHLAAQNTTA